VLIMPNIEAANIAYQDDQGFWPNALPVGPILIGAGAGRRIS